MIRQKMIPNGRKHYTHSCGRAGDVSIDLFNGKMTYTHSDIKGRGALPVQISHVYSDFNKNEMILSDGSTLSLADSHCGYKFKLNVDKRLVKETFTGLNGQASSRYILIDADGTETVFDEKFFYKSAGQKVFVLAQDVSIAQSGELSYIDSNKVTHEIEREFISDSGLVLSGKYEGLKNIERINQDIDEVAQLKYEIKQIDQTLLELNHSLSINNYQSTINGYNESINTNTLEIQKLNNKILENNNNLTKNLEVSRQTLNNVKHARIAPAETLFNVAQALVDTVESSQKAEYEAHAQMRQQDLFDIMVSDIVGNMEQDVVYGEKNENGVRSGGTLLLQQNLYNETCSMISNIEQLYIYDKTNKESNLNDEKNLLKQKIDDLNIAKEQKMYQLKQLLKQVPEYFISDANGNIMGFTNIEAINNGEIDGVDLATENEEAATMAQEKEYRLVLIADSYENAILISFDDENKITKVINSDEKEIVFNYNSEDLLESIVDDRGRKVSYTYAGGLTEIIYPNGRTTTLNYEGEYLTAIFSPNKKGVALTYIDDKASEIKGLSKYKNIGNDVLEEVTTNDETIGILGVNYLITSKKKINYVDYRTTVILDEKTGKTHTHLMNIYGETICEYDCKSSSADAMKEAYNVSYNLLTDRKQFSVKPLMMAEELLTGSGLFTGIGETSSELYLGEDIIVGVAYATEINTQLQVGEDENVYSTDTNTKIFEKNVSASVIEKIKEEGITDLMFGAWAKAGNSDPVLPKFTDCSENGVDNYDDNLYYGEELSGDTFKGAKFELRAEITYLVGSKVETILQYASFDYKNTGWQYVAFPVSLSTDKNYVLSEIKVVFDFSGQSGYADFYGMSLKEADWKYIELNEYKQTTYVEESKKDLITVYEYDEDKNLIKTIATNKNTNETLVTEYIYNDKKQLALVADSLGNVSENEYNENGVKIRTISYNKGMASAKYYEEAKLDENGKEIGASNEFGETVCEYEYSESDVLTNEKHPDGTKVGYGYDEYEDTLLEITSTVEGKTNSNTYEYTDELVTGLTHNGTKYRFTYDAEGRKIKTHINDILYEDITINNILDESGVLKQKETDKMFATGERVYITEDADGKIIKMEYTNNGGTRCILNNIYDTCGNLIRTKDGIIGTNYDFIYDKYGRIVEKISSNNGKVIKVANTYNKDDSIAETSFEIDGVRKTSTNTYTESVFDRKLTGIYLSNDLTEDITYDKLNRKKSTNIGGILSKNLSYLTKGDRTSNLISAEWFGINGVIKDNLTYKYDVKGNITAVKENGIEIVRYTYDGIDRLIREDNKKLNKTTTYFYDEGGNLTDKYEYAYTLTETEKLIGGERISYGYSDEGWRDLLLDYNGELCEYDRQGNPTTYRGKSLSWTRGRLLERYDRATYIYNVNGIRTQKAVNGVITSFYLDGDKILAQDMYSANT
ncbi:MAG: RHS repeat protein, partial [Clostridiales bacterium]|nr:RHS repeat protein [Clostridiales bacterium]